MEELTTLLDEKIKYEEEAAEKQKKLYRLCPASESDLFNCDGTKDCRTLENGKNKGCRKCEAEHRQLSEWLKDYKRLLENEQMGDNAIDKIRAKIEQIADEEYKHDKQWAIGLRYAIKIIDNHKKENEENNMENTIDAPTAQIITAPSIEEPKFTSVFLAGGITNCKEWQKEVIKNLEYENVSFFNPRQEHFDVTDKNASYKQILWEFERLEKMDIFSMYFCNDNSDQPICMYELGRNIVRMQNKFPNDWDKRIIISVEDGYRRKNDVLIQTDLATHTKVYVDTNATPDLHAQYIRRAIFRLK